MIVIHVRKSGVSTKELEASVLYTGHLISMQQNSFEQRTVASMINILNTVNDTKATDDE